MKTTTHAGLLAFGSGVLLAANLAVAPPAVAQGYALATAAQRSAETLASKLIASAEVRRQIAVSERAFAGLPQAADPEARRTLHSAVQELAFAAALDAANSDPVRPGIVWGFTAPRTWLGRNVPGSRWGIDNPDNVYRFVPVDGASKYEISVHNRSPGPVQYSFLIYDSYVGEDGRAAHLDAPVAGIRDRDLKIGSDGSFTISIDSSPAAGRDNHIQSTAESRVLLIRNTFSDWGGQLPQEVSIRRMGPAGGARPSRPELEHRAAQLLGAATTTLVGWETGGFASRKAANVIGKPAARGGGWGFAAGGNFNIRDDEALVVTLDTLGAKYVGFDLTNPWLVSLEHIHGSGSLNNSQAQANPDGTITYVVAARDPGVYNWLNTAGLHSGNILIRWQVLPDSVTGADQAVRAVRVVKLDGLSAALPAGTQRVSAAERRTLVTRRAAEYAHRYAGTAETAEKLATR